MPNNSALLNASQLGIAGPLAEMIAEANRTEAAQMGLHQGHRQANEYFLQKMAERDTVILAHQAHGQAVPEAEMEVLDAAVERADFERRAAYAAASGHSKTVAVPAKERLREAEFYLATNAPHLRVVPAPTIKGKPRDALDSATEAIAAKKAERRAFRDRPAPPSVVLAAALADLDRYRLPVLPDVYADGQLGWDSSARGLDIFGHDKVELVHDARAFYLADPANYQTVRDHIERTVRDRYRSIKDTATEAEKRKRLAQLDGEILELQRVQVAAIRALRATGEQVPFPHGIDLRAVISVDGPKPRSR